MKAANKIFTDSDGSKFSNLNVRPSGERFAIWSLDEKRIPMILANAPTHTAATIIMAKMLAAAQSPAEP